MVLTWADIERRLDDLYCGLSPEYHNLFHHITRIQHDLTELIFTFPYAIENSGLPHASGIYFWTRHDEILYIGRSADIKNRWMKRRDLQVTAASPVHYLLQRVDGVAVYNLATMESFFISSIRPAYNATINNRITIFGPPSPNSGH